jgi:predicted nucleotide-binding protein
MARKIPQRTPEMPLYLAVPREEATQKITERIKRGEDLKSRPMDTEERLKGVQKEYWTWDEYNIEMLRQMFTSAKIAVEYDPPSHIFSLGERSLQERIRDFHDSLDGKIRTLASIRERLELIPVAPGLERPHSTPQSRATLSDKKVFLVHGRDDGAREAVARFIEKLDLNPVILHEQASQGRTIVEKLEHHGDVSYAIVLLTPDDVGGVSPNELRPRARQNVVLELGYFMARLGRQNVCALYCGELELPSDYMGVIYIPYDAGGGWQLQLAKELKAAGFSIDMNKAV